MAKTASYTINDNAEAAYAAAAVRWLHGVKDADGNPTETLRECFERVLKEQMDRVIAKAIRRYEQSENHDATIQARVDQYLAETASGSDF